MGFGFDIQIGFSFYHLLIRYIYVLHFEKNSQYFVFCQGKRGLYNGYYFSKVLEVFGLIQLNTWDRQLNELRRNFSLQIN